MNKRCSGCGAIMQSEKIQEHGYTPAEKIKDSLYCERCFRIMHYNEPSVTKLDYANDKIRDFVNENAKYVYFLIDFLNINKETIEMYKSIKVKKSLIVSKIDIIPKSIKENVITEWLKSEYGIKDGIMYQSTKKNLNTKSLLRKISDFGIKECYILGYTNAGKSTLINRLCSYKEEKTNEITTSLLPNTTIDFITVEIDDCLQIIDSPGFTLNDTLYTEDEFDLIKKINPKNRIKPITYQTKEISSILIEDKIRLKANIKNSLTFYMSNDIKIERVFPNNTKLTEKKHFVLDIPDNSDLVIHSLGFINIKKSCKLEIYSDKENLFEVRKSMFNE